MIRTRDELLNAIKAVLPEDSTDEVLTLLEDVTDTLDSVADSEEWRAKYDDLDKSWRERYKARFFANPAENDAQEEADPDENVDEEPTRFEELFD